METGSHDEIHGRGAVGECIRIRGAVQSLGDLLTLAIVTGRYSLCSQMLGLARMELT